MANAGIPKSLHFRSITKVHGKRRGSDTLNASIPVRIVRLMRLQPGDSVEWVWTNNSHGSYCKLVRISARKESDLV